MRALMLSVLAIIASCSGRSPEVTGAAMSGEVEAVSACGGSDSSLGAETSGGCDELSQKVPSLSDEPSIAPYSTAPATGD